MYINIKNTVFWDVALCVSCENQRFAGTYLLHHQYEKNQRARNNVSRFLRSVLQLLVTDNVVPISLILFTLMIEVTSSETSVLTGATRRYIPEDGILHSR
jgi:hypothetical protein